MTDRPKTDVLSEVLRAVRLRGAVFFSVTARTPWVAESAHGRVLAPLVLPGADHVIQYHVVRSSSPSRCYARMSDGTALELAPGDMVVFPHGDAHTMASSADIRGEPDFTVYRHAVDHGLPLPVEMGGGGDQADVVCGFLACDAKPFNPLIAALPRMMHVRKTNAGFAQMLDYFTDTVVTESHKPRSGSDVVVARLSELMFVEAIREWIATLPPEQSGWLGGLRDEIVGRALGALHASPKKDWALDTLAREVGASRSALAERFTEHVGIPPMQYLAQWRMQLAATLLSGPKTLAEIASEVGYGSEAAFSRAFKKIVGVPPAGWRAKLASA